MEFSSILFDQDGVRLETSQPDFFADLGLDQIVNAVATSERGDDLKPFFWTPLRDVETVRYRQEVMNDLEKDAVLEGVKVFSEGMALTRRYLTMLDRLDYEYNRKGWFLEAALVYRDAVAAFTRHLAEVPLRSRGLRLFRDYLGHYVQSDAFRSFSDESARVKNALSEVAYTVIIQGGQFKVRRYEGDGEVDYSREVEEVFEKFKQGNAQNYLVNLPDRIGMSHVEAKILEFVVRLYPEPFEALDRFCSRYTSFMDDAVQAFDREIQFYIAFLDLIAALKRSGLPFCYPEVTTTDKAIHAREGFDLALALRHRDHALVLNDFFLEGPERILVVTGPNQGGKTTFARMFGQLHYLASLGCPVPCREARLFLPDRIFTHFEREEDIGNLRGKLEDDLIRIHAMLTRATGDSLFVLNEIFSSTSSQDALFLGREIMFRQIELDVLSVWVTFLDELASMGEKTVSMVALADPRDPATRTFKIVRHPADGLAYALSLARKHGLTYGQILERLS